MVSPFLKLESHYLFELIIRLPSILNTIFSTNLKTNQRTILRVTDMMEKLFVRLLFGKHYRDYLLSLAH